MLDLMDIGKLEWLIRTETPINETLINKFITTSSKAKRQREIEIESECVQMNKDDLMIRIVNLVNIIFSFYQSLS